MKLKHLSILLFLFSLNACGGSSTSSSQSFVSITVTPPSATIPNSTGGLTQLFSATAKDNNGNAVSGVVFSWISSNPAIACIDQQGLAQPRVQNGNVTITAQAGMVSSLPAALALNLSGPPPPPDTCK